MDGQGGLDKGAQFLVDVSSCSFSFPELGLHISPGGVLPTLVPWPVHPQGVERGAFHPFPFKSTDTDNKTLAARGEGGGGMGELGERD